MPSISLLDRNRKKPKKIVLYGLDKYDPQDILEELKACNIDPIEVKTMTIKDQKYENHNNYLVYFRQMDVITLEKLKTIKSIFDTIIRWDIYKYKNIGPSQCRRCFMYGHAENGCRMDFKCGVCAKDHQTKECPLIEARNKAGKTKISPKLLKCANCGENHVSTYRECTVRTNYIENKQRYQQQKKVIFNHTNNRHQQDGGQFQHQQQRRQTDHNVNFNTSSRVRPGVSYSDVSKNQELFSPEECMNLLKDLLSRLKTCQSKEDQLMVIANITVEYLYQ